MGTERTENFLEQVSVYILRVINAREQLSYLERVGRFNSGNLEIHIAHVSGCRDFDVDRFDR